MTLSLYSVAVTLLYERVQSSWRVLVVVVKGSPLIPISNMAYRVCTSGHDLWLEWIGMLALYITRRFIQNVSSKTIRSSVFVFRDRSPRYRLERYAVVTSIHSEPVAAHAS